MQAPRWRLALGKTYRPRELVLNKGILPHLSNSSCGILVLAVMLSLVLLECESDSYLQEERCARVCLSLDRNVKG